MLGDVSGRHYIAMEHVHGQTLRVMQKTAAEWVLGSRKLPDPFVWQHVDDEFAAKLSTDREALPAVRRRLEVLV